MNSRDDDMADNDKTILPGGMSLHTGLVLNDRFELVSKLGKGGMARVWRARHAFGGLDLALKFTEPQFRHLSEDEFRLLTQLHHDNVVRIMDMGPVTKRSDGRSPSDQLFLTMALVDGPTLKDLIESDGDELGADVQVTWLRQLISVLTYLHSMRVIHRDIKPGNIVIDSSSWAPKAVLIDFNISDIDDPKPGTPAYKCPHVEAERRWMPFADVWALAVAFWELFTGSMLFRSIPSFDVALDARLTPGVPKKVGEALKAIIRSDIPNWDHLDPSNYAALFGLPEATVRLLCLPEELAHAWKLSKNEQLLLVELLNQENRRTPRSRSALARDVLKAKGMPASEKAISRLERAGYGLTGKGVAEYTGNARKKRIRLTEDFLKAIAEAGL